MNLSKILTKLRDPRTNWKYIFIVAISAFVVGGGILAWQWRMLKEETKIPEKVIQPEEEFAEKTVLDSRILLTQEKWEELSTYAEIGHTANLEPPNATVLYSNSAKDISLQIPYNPKWGSEKYKIPPYYEYEERILFGPIFPFEAGLAARGCVMSFLSVRSAEEVIASLKEISFKGIEFPAGIEEESIIIDTINGVTVIKYLFVDQLIGTYPQVEVIGNKHNYHFYCFYGMENEMEVYEKMIRTIQFVE